MYFCFCFAGKIKHFCLFARIHVWYQLWCSIPSLPQGETEDNLKTTFQRFKNCQNSCINSRFNVQELNVAQCKIIKPVFIMTKWLNTVLKLWKNLVRVLFWNIWHLIFATDRKRGQMHLYASQWWQNPLYQLLQCYFSTKLFIHADIYTLSEHRWNLACLFLNIKIKYIIMRRGRRGTPSSPLISKRNPQMLPR